MNFLIFPNTIVEDLNLIKNYNNIYLIKEQYFYNNNEIKKNYLNKCIDEYYDYLNNNIKNNNIIILNNYNKLINKEFDCFDFLDFELFDLYKKLNIKLNIIQNPFFLTEKNENNNILEDYYNKTKNNKKIIFNNFFNFVKQNIKELNFLKNIKSTDKDNRLKLNDEKLLNLIKQKDLNNELIYNFKDAKNYYNIFLNKYFKYFGDFQDYMDKDYHYNFHSNISYLLNNGILNIRFVLIKAIEQKNIKLNSKEGFIRQLIWREYMFFIYKYYHDQLKNIIRKDNYWNNKNKINWNLIYVNNNFNINFFDNEIMKGIKTSYLHHIVRLNILSFFILLELNPEDIILWFLNLISLDAYNWVMFSNIISMGYFSPKFMSKPYLFSSNYIKKMSNYKLSTEEQTIINSLYYCFLYKNKNKNLYGYSFTKFNNIDYHKNIKNNYLKTLKFINN